MNKNPTSEHPDAYFVGYISFILWAVAFSGLCVVFVRMFAPYACGKSPCCDIVDPNLHQLCYLNKLSAISTSLVKSNNWSAFECIQKCLFFIYRCDLLKVIYWMNVPIEMFWLILLSLTCGEPIIHLSTGRWDLLIRVIRGIRLMLSTVS